jgi:hypothetical protein
MVASAGILLGSYGMYKSNKTGERMNQIADENAMYRTKQMNIHTQPAECNTQQSTIVTYLGKAID